jgi:hypothetical protein
VRALASLTPEAPRDHGREVQDVRAGEAKPAQTRGAPRDERPTAERLVLTEPLAPNGARSARHRERQNAAGSGAKPGAAIPLELGGRAPRGALEHASRFGILTETAAETTRIVITDASFQLRHTPET